MKLRIRWLWNQKDGGPESTVWMYGLEIKSLFSVLLLRFENGSREAYHSHAFNCINWVLKGELIESVYYTHFKEPCVDVCGTYLRKYKAEIKPFIITREDFHKVSSIGRTYVLSFRGPWVDKWKELINGKAITLTHGRKIVND